MTKAFINERQLDIPAQGDEIVNNIHGSLTADPQTVEFTTSTASDPFHQDTEYIDFTVTAAAHYKIGDEGTTAAVTDQRINAGERIPERVGAGQIIAFIDAAD